MIPLLEETLHIAKSRIGVREIGTSNTGPEVDAYLASVGDPPGNPWCAAFAYTNINDAAKSLGVPNPYLRSGYCPDIGNWARSRGILKPDPIPGCTFLQIHGGDFHHTGHVLSVDGDSFITIEGNTNTSGAREGIEVAVQHRTVSERFGFVHWDALCDDMSTRRLLIAGQTPAEPLLQNLPVRSNITLLPLRTWCEHLGIPLGFDGSEEPPWMVGSNRIAGQVSLIDGHAYMPLRAVVDATPMALAVGYDAATDTVTIDHAGASQ